MSSKYMTFVAVLMVIGSLLLLVGKYVPLGLTLLGPIIVNILLFHFTLMHGGAAGGLIAAVFEIFLIVAYRRSFRGIFDADPPPSTTI
ncbi:DoxX family protein [Terriglobus saanensis]|nr:DoxX family protein [Terriglobus saanensis]